MKKFIVTYHMPADTWQQSKNASPEEMAEGMKPWMAWAEKCGEALVDFGTPLSGGQKVTSDGTTPSEKDVAGYSILQAESMDDAVKLMVDHPHLKWSGGCEIEVHESMPMEGM